MTRTDNQTLATYADPEKKAASTIYQYTNHKHTTALKNFFYQTWVVALLVVAVLGVVCYIAFSAKKDGETTTPPNEETKE